MAARWRDGAKDTVTDSVSVMVSLPSLPSADFSICDTEEADGSEGEELFCRSRYIESKGVDENATANKGNSSDSPLPALSSGAQDSEAGSGNSTKDDEVCDEDDWEAFKDEFSSSKEPENDAVDSAYIKEQLLINTLTYLHSVSSMSGSARGVEADTSGNGVLSLNNLEMIEESELDKALESIHLLEGPREANPGAHKGYQVPLAWDQTHAADITDSALMGRLEELSLNSGMASDPCATKGTLGSPEPKWKYTGTGRTAGDKQTVFLDLRPEQAAFSAHTITVSSSAQRLLALKGILKQFSSSGSDTDENEVLWREQRTKLKTGDHEPQTEKNRRGYVPTGSLHTAKYLLEECVIPSVSDNDSHVSSDDHFCDDVHADPPQMPNVPSGDCSTEREVPQSHTDPHGGKGLHKESLARCVPTSKCECKREQRPKKKSKQKGKGEQKREDNGVRKNVASSVKIKHSIPSDGGKSSVCDGISSVSGSGVSDGTSSVSDGTSSVSDGTSSVSDGTSSVSDGTSSVSDGTSSVSDGTSSVSDGTSSVSDGTSSVMNDKKSSVITESKPEVIKSGSSKKKKGSKNKNSGSTKGSKKSEQKQHKTHRKRVLSTSTDEDVALTPGEEKVEVPRSVEDVKTHLRDYIMSKKPPATFEAPATQPTFHEDASFGAVKATIDPTQTTDGLFILKLSEAGTLEQPAGSPLSADAQTSFHCLLLSWLAALAAAAGKGPPALGPAVVPFRVTGLLQTVINGSRCLVVGVASLTGQPLATGEGTDAGSENAQQSALQNALTQVTVRAALQPVMVFAFKYLKAAILEELEPILVLPLSALFVHQEDLSPLGTHISFYWYSLYTAASHPTGESLRSRAVLETTVCAIPLSTPSQAELVLAVVQQAFRVGLDLAGIRLVYNQSAQSLIEGNGTETGGGGGPTTPGLATLVLALRGPDAVRTWIDVVGPRDVVLARITDPESINAQFSSPGQTSLECVRTPYTVALAIALGFGGRTCVRTGSVLGVSDPSTKSERRKRQRVRFSDSSESDELSRSSSSHSSESPTPSPLLPPLLSNLPTLVVPPFGKFVLTLSPQVSPVFYPCVLATCSRLGFDFLGVKRLRLNQRRASSLGIPAHCMSSFTPSSSSPTSTSPTCVPRSCHPAERPITPPDVDLGSPPLPSTFLLLARENAPLHSGALMRAVLGDLAAMQRECSNAPTCAPFGSSAVHALECSDAVLGMLGGFCPLPPMVNTQAQLPDQASGYPEEVCVVAATQSSGLVLAVEFLSAVFGVSAVSSSAELSYSRACLGDTSELGGLELLGMKLVPQLSRYHAKQLCPLEPSSPFYQAALNALSDAPVLLMVLRGLQCNVRVQRLVPELVRSASEPKVSLITSTSFQQAYNLLSVFFTDKELFCDYKGRALSQYTPCPSIDCILSGLQDPVQPLCSVFSVAASQGGLIVRVMEKLCRAGFKFVGMTCADQRDGSEKGGSTELLVVCVEHTNAVWYLKKQLEPFVRSSTLSSTAISYSNSYKEAMADIAQYFPRGVYCQSTIYHQLNCSAVDDLLVHPSPPPSSPFMETTFVVHCPSHSSGSSQSELVRCLDLLVQAGFCFLGISMMWFSAAKARDLLLACPSKVSLDDLTSGPSVVFQLLRDNAASCFSAVMRRLLSKSDLRLEVKELDNLESTMVVPKNTNEAKAVMRVLSCEG